MPTYAFSIILERPLSLDETDFAYGVAQQGTPPDPASGRDGSSPFEDDPLYSEIAGVPQFSFELDAPSADEAIRKALGFITSLGKSFPRAARIEIEPDALPAAP